MTPLMPVKKFGAILHTRFIPDQSQPNTTML